MTDPSSQEATCCDQYGLPDPFTIKGVFYGWVHVLHLDKPDGFIFCTTRQYIKPEQKNASQEALARAFREQKGFIGWTDARVADFSTEENAELEAQVKSLQAQLDGDNEEMACGHPFKMQYINTAKGISVPGPIPSCSMCDLKSAEAKLSAQEAEIQRLRDLLTRLIPHLRNNKTLHERDFQTLLAEAQAGCGKP